MPGAGEFLCGGDRVSVLQEEKVLEVAGCNENVVDVTDLHA